MVDGKMDEVKNRKIKVAVIGVGYLGKIHAKIYQGMPNVDLVAVVDTSSSAVNAVCEQFGCQGFTNVEDLPRDIDAVSIVVPTSLHLPVSEFFLRRKIHTMLEKPIAPSVVESQKIVDMAEESGAILQIGHLERFNAGVMKLAELAANPRFIEIHRLGTFVERATDVDVVTDLMIHDIDIVLSLVDSPIRHISATGTSVVTDHVDIANARLEFDSGAVANVTASRVSRSQFRRIRVFSKQHYLGLNFADQQLEEVLPGEVKPGGRFPELINRKIHVEPQLPLDAELDHFIQCVENNTTPLVTGQHGLVAVQVAEMVRQKIASSM